MNTLESSAPIYYRLVKERGDVPAEVRRAAEQIQAELGRVMVLPPLGRPAEGQHH
ncbi:hypothetical protein ABZO31_01350 [Streptomyces sp. HUAS MG47]|uniref:hypothetical protein n=1 Tax=Streptomyces solicamelliae TaxID=3231716 RepID=UPI003878006B